MASIDEHLTAAERALAYANDSAKAMQAIGHAMIAMARQMAVISADLRAVLAKLDDLPPG